MTAAGPRVSGDVGLFERERGQRLLSIALAWVDECMQQLLRRVAKGHEAVLEGRERNERLLASIEEQYRQGLDVMVGWGIGDIQREAQLILARDDDSNETLRECVKYFAIEYCVTPRPVTVSDLLTTFVPIFSKRVDVRRVTFARHPFIDRRAVVIDCLRCALVKLSMTFDPQTDTEAPQSAPRARATTPEAAPEADLQDLQNLEAPEAVEALSLVPPSYVPNPDEVRVAAVSLFGEE
jgi:hypothetical protein